VHHGLDATGARREIIGDEKDLRHCHCDVIIDSARLPTPPSARNDVPWNTIMPASPGTECGQAGRDIS
jgi:hypothetical protein